MGLEITTDMAEKNWTFDCPFGLAIGDFNADTKCQQKFGSELHACSREGLISSSGLIHVVYNDFIEQ